MEVTIKSVMQQAIGSCLTNLCNVLNHIIPSLYFAVLHDLFTKLIDFPNHFSNNHIKWNPGNTGGYLHYFHARAREHESRKSRTNIFTVCNFCTYVGEDMVLRGTRTKLILSSLDIHFLFTTQRHLHGNRALHYVECHNCLRDNKFQCNVLDPVFSF